MRRAAIKVRIGGSPSGLMIVSVAVTRKRFFFQIVAQRQSDFVFVVA